MLSPELKNLKDYLEGKKTNLDENKLLDELKNLDKADIKSLNESLAVSSNVCPTCGRSI
ncbi:hypothetical protein [Clostridium beijerinckii]|jgi:tRNA(Ile2) C34 agmatinyltransferase TiaS|uniref:Uncharacterized protein n=1 Tax=Clostridium beijerinckii TaxID=1520 RepID=A0AAW3W8F2_CLOBE|nr:hypothetical protein [Clostridium beijerinckii]MRY42941.1 hypothetical protein [Parabacteroides distasonis]MBC2457751.1 hypothetical protein [Clostridium beijerinckii]MBC2475057.1 hypothetical protein [Clostridium beijerinckii]MDG5854884.1 hypothetical protein [Clostridium beijerinckii]MZK52033.1 hypothetical protein [Clostridium beijerinckii]